MSGKEAGFKYSLLTPLRTVRTTFTVYGSSQYLEIQCFRFFTTFTDYPDAYVYKPKPAPNFSQSVKSHFTFNQAHYLYLPPFGLGKSPIRPVMSSGCLSVDGFRVLGHLVSARDFCLGYPSILALALSPDLAPGLLDT